MPASKHRRKGKTRPRDNLKNVHPVRREPLDDTEDRRIDAIIDARLRELHGERQWSDYEYDEATAQLEAEGKIPPL